MAKLQFQDISENGDYEIDLLPGFDYYLTLKTESPTDGNASLYFNNGADASFAAPDNTPAMLGNTGISEIVFTAPSNQLRITLDASFSNPIRVSLGLINK